MAASFSQTILVGNLGADPELSYTPSGTAKAVIRLATHEVWNDAQGERRTRTEWHRTVYWGRMAEVCGEILGKGDMILVEGRNQTRSWEDRDGNRRYMTEVIGRRMQLLKKKVNGDGAEPQPQEVDAPELAEPDDDIPF